MVKNGLEPCPPTFCVWVWWHFDSLLTAKSIPQERKKSALSAAWNKEQIPKTLHKFVDLFKAFLEVRSNQVNHMTITGNVHTQRKQTRQCVIECLLHVSNVVGIEYTHVIKLNVEVIHRFYDRLRYRFVISCT